MSSGQVQEAPQDQQQKADDCSRCCWCGTDLPISKENWRKQFTVVERLKREDGISTAAQGQLISLKHLDVCDARINPADLIAVQLFEKLNPELYAGAIQAPSSGPPEVVGGFQMQAYNAALGANHDVVRNLRDVASVFLRPGAA